jgi:RNA polymerase sigma-70 factor (ECF subfamily)
MLSKRLLRDRRHARLHARALAGDDRAFARLYRELYDVLAPYLASRVSSPEDAEDLLGKLFHRFLEKLPEFDAAKGSVLAWILQMARNAVIDHWRGQRASRPIEELTEVLADGAADPLEKLVLSEEARFTGGLLADYPAETREIFALRFGQNLRYREIAECLGLSEDAVKQRFSRTLRELRRQWRGRETKRGEVDYAI